VWTKLQKSVDKYLAKSGEGDAATDPKAKEVLLGFLKSLVDDTDKTKTVIELLEDHLDDVARVSKSMTLLEPYLESPGQPPSHIPTHGGYMKN